MAISACTDRCKWTLLCSVFVLFIALGPCDADTPNATFYQATCPQATSIVKKMVGKLVSADRIFAGAFIRLHFHDCWVRGCDGSVLLNTTSNNVAERDGHGNFELRGVPEIDDIKYAVEAACPGVVSCADIVALAARDAVVKVGGPSWPVLLGRRDGVVSSADEANVNLPFPVLNFKQLVQNFAVKNFSAREMVVLSGAHTIGRTTCNGVAPHLYNFTGVEDLTDPTLDKTFAKKLKKQCPKGNRNNTLRLDSTAGKFDRFYYKNVISNKGIFITDAALITDPVGEQLVASFSRKKSTFFDEFSAAMVKMGNLELLTGTEGEIRQHCQFVNTNP
ncbi:hypothetical protein Mapa_009254 [Marchantia paleacea]|nr:hypothetical protein Mapa_009254 [Marchantia paleacea]